MNDMEAEVRAYAIQHFADGYRPIKYIFVDKFPLTKMGKVDYRTLEEKEQKNESIFYKFCGFSFCIKVKD